MKRIVFIVCICAGFLFTGCVGTAQGDTKPSTVQETTQTTEEEEMNQSNDAFVQALIQLLSCDQDVAEDIAQTTEIAGLETPVSLKGFAEKDKKDLIIVDAKGVEYRVYFDRQMYVYAIQAVESGEYVYRTMQ